MISCWLDNVKKFLKKICGFFGHTNIKKRLHSLRSIKVVPLDRIDGLIFIGENTTGQGPNFTICTKFCAQP